MECTRIAAMKEKVENFSKTSLRCLSTTCSSIINIIMSRHAPCVEDDVIGSDLSLGSLVLVQKYKLQK